MDVVTLGECMALAFPTSAVSLADADALALDMAGAESNLCIALARLGFQTRFITRVGADPFGERLRRLLTQEGVSTDALILDEQAPSGLFFREHLKDGQRRVYYYRANSAASRLEPDDLDPNWFANCKILHLTGITPALSHSCAESCQRAIELAKANGALISFDPNYRAKLWQPSAAREALIPLMRQCDILLIGHEDAAAILDSQDPAQTMDYCTGLGPRWIVLKMGESGAIARVDGQDYPVASVPARQVVDPVGAGDGFNAGFLAGMLRGWEIPRALELAAKIGSAAVEVMGDYAGYPRGL